MLLEERSPEVMTLLTRTRRRVEPGLAGVVRRRDEGADNRRDEVVLRGDHLPIRSPALL
jgi:hypothetical protein